MRRLVSPERRPKKPGGVFESDEFCAQIDSYAEAVGVRASRLMGYDPETEPRLLTFALAFDLTARARSQRWQNEHLGLGGVSGVGRVVNGSRALFDEWAKTVPPNVAESIVR